jgi:enoyl-CoA hydratase/carnithine racemase
MTATNRPPAPSFHTLTVGLDGRVGRIVLDRPDRLNPLGATALRELADAAAWFDRTDAVAVVVEGAGRAFSAGFDLREFAPAASAAEARSAVTAAVPALGAAMANAIGAMSAVTVAAVHGPCLGGGLVLALACDIRIASDEAWFSLPEADLGIPLGWTGVPRMVRELGPARTIELVLSCRRFDAHEALALGVCNRVVPHSELHETVLDVARSIASKRREVVVTTKRQVRAAADSLVPTTGRWDGTEELIRALRTLRDGAGA